MKINPIYPHQWRTAKQIQDHYQCGVPYVILTAQPQSGKTGVARALIKMLNAEYRRSIWFLCGMNDLSLKQQQVNEFYGLIPPSNILFSKDLEKIVKEHVEVEGLDEISRYAPFSHSLFILDEAHYAQRGETEVTEHMVYDHSLIHKFFTQIVGITLDGVMSKWKPVDVRFLSISATPMSELANTLNEDCRKMSVMLHPGPKYYGFGRMLSLNRVHPSYVLSNDSHRGQFINVLKTMYTKQSQAKEYKYAIIRFCNTVGGKVVQQKFKEELAAAGVNAEYINFHSQLMDIKDINDTLRRKPTNMTIIMIYNSLRAGFQLNTSNICLVHDTANAFVDVTAQGLAGRCCGYHKEADAVEVYCNLPRLRKYVKLIINDFDPECIPAKCHNIAHGGSQDEGGNRNFTSDVPTALKLSPTLVDQLLTYKAKHGSRYPNFKETFEKIFGELLKSDPKWSGRYWVGTTLLDETNVTTGNTNTWIKFWAPAFKAAQNGKPGAYFRRGKLPPDVVHFKYVYINLRKDHPQYGYMLVTYQSRIITGDNESTIRTTGKETFHPKNNPEDVSLATSNLPTSVGANC